MPRASLRSVFTTIADSAAFTWRVSSSTTSSPPCVRPACSHCDSGPALEPDPRHHQAELAEEPNQRLGLTGHLGLSDDPSGPLTTHTLLCSSVPATRRSRHNAPWLSLEDA